MKFENGRIVIESGTELGIIDVIGVVLVYFGLRATGHDPSMMFLAGAILILMGALNAGSLRIALWSAAFTAIIFATRFAGFL